MRSLRRRLRYYADWLDWAHLYPLWRRSRTGKLMVLRYLYRLGKRHPRSLAQLCGLIDQVIEEERLRDAMHRRRDGDLSGPDHAEETLGAVRDAIAGAHREEIQTWEDEGGRVPDTDPPYATQADIIGIRGRRKK